MFEAMDDDFPECKNCHPTPSPKQDEQVEFTPSCGNVFEDLGLPDADKLMIESLKQQLSAERNLAIELREEVQGRKDQISDLHEIIEAERKEHQEFWDTALSESVGLRYNYESKTITNERAESLSKRVDELIAQSVEDFNSAEDQFTEYKGRIESLREIAKEDRESAESLQKRIDETVEILQREAENPHVVYLHISALSQALAKLTAKEGCP